MRLFTEALRDSLQMVMIITEEELYSRCMLKRLLRQTERGHLEREPGSTKISRGGGHSIRN